MSARTTRLPTLLASALNGLVDPDVSASRIGNAEMLARIHNALSEGADISHRTASVNAILAAIHNAVSSGPDVSHLTHSRAQLLAGIHNALSDDADLSRLTTSEPALWHAAFGAVGGEGGGVSALWSADFQNAVYERGGVATTLDAMFQDYAPGPTAGVGFEAGTNPYVKHGSAAEADLNNNATFVIEAILGTGSAENEMVLSASSEDFGAGRDLYIVTEGVPRTRIDTYGPVTNTTYNSNAYAPTGAVKIAVTFSGGHVAFSVDGAAVTSGDPADDVDMTWFYFTVPLGSAAKLKTITAYAAQADAALPALST
jgi:hypothetical protein